MVVLLVLVQVGLKGRVGGSDRPGRSVVLRAKFSRSILARSDCARFLETDLLKTTLFIAASVPLSPNKHVHEKEKIKLSLIHI